MDLSTYVRVGRYDLPEPTRTAAPANNVLAQEVSAVTYDWDTDSLFVVGDGGTAIVQVTKTGQLIDTMTLAPGGSAQGTEFFDPEGLTYIGNGRFVMTEERDRNAVLFTYAAGTTLTRAAAQTAHLGTNVGNVGLEGLSYDPLTNGFIFVKEKTPEGVFQTTIDFATDTASNGSATTVNPTNLFDPTLLNVIDLADVFALSNLPATAGTADQARLLLLSQESAKIVEADRAGNVYSTLSIVSDPGNPLDVVSQQHEGLTVDRAGNIYVVSENGGGDFDHPQLWVYAPSATLNAAPNALRLTTATAAIEENTSTTARVKVSDIVVSDDGLGTNVIALTGADAGAFEADSTGLYIKAGTALDFETKTSYQVTVTVDDPTVGATPDATAPFTLNVTNVVNENVAPAVYISEVAAFSSGNSPVGADWFEVTNASSAALDITGWRVDDSSNSFAASLALNGVTSIAPGASVIFLETNTLAATSATFVKTWFGATAPAGLQFGSYTGSGIGLSTGGDAVNLFDSSGAVKASVVFGPSPPGTFATFNNAAGLDGATISTLSAVGVNGAFVAPGNPTEVGSPGTVGRLVISEVAAFSSGNSPVGADWFEVTNTSAFAIDISGWKVDDSSQSPAAALALNGVTNIAPGESVIFLETSNLAATRTAFIDTWFGNSVPTGLQFGSYTGAGIGLSTGGDGVNLYDATNTLRASVSFGTSPSGPYATFDNAAGRNDAAIAQLSVTGTNGAFAAIHDPVEIGSPGRIVSGPVITDDTLFRGAGDDTVYSGAGNDGIDGGAGNDIIDGGAGSDRLYGNDGNDQLYGGAGSDLLIGNDGNDGLDGGIGNDTLDGGLGDDRLYGNDGDDQLFGNAGQDLLIGNTGNDGLDGGIGNDILDGGDGDDRLYGNDGDDQLFGSAGRDLLVGNTGNDGLDGGIGDDILDGGDGDDRLYGNDGDDQLFGGAGNDQLVGNIGNDLLDGGAGSDIFYAGDGADTVRGGDGFDLLYLSGQAQDFSYLQIDGGYAFRNGATGSATLVYGVEEVHYGDLVFTPPVATPLSLFEMA